MANMKFIGHLFLLDMLKGNIVASITQELLCCHDNTNPQEHIVECVCELLTAIGTKFEATQKECVTQVCGRLMDLKNMKKEDGSGKSLLSKRIGFTIQDVIEMRKAGWTKKTFKERPKTKEEIRAQQAHEDELSSKGKVVPGETHVAGAINNRTDNSSKNDGDWNEIPKKTKRR
jgi:hypothetical protein